MDKAPHCSEVKETQECVKVRAERKLGVCTFEVEVRMCLSLGAQRCPQKWLLLPLQNRDRKCQV